ANERAQSDMKRRSEEDKHHLSSQHQQQISDLKDTIAALRSQLGVRESELQLISDSETEFHIQDNSAALWRKMMDKCKGLFETELDLAAAFGPHAPFEVLASSNEKQSPKDSKLISMLQQAVPDAASLEINRVQVCNTADVADLHEARPDIKNIAIAP